MSCGGAAAGMLGAAHRCALLCPGSPRIVPGVAVDAQVREPSQEHQEPGAHQRGPRPARPPPQVRARDPQAPLRARQVPAAPWEGGLRGRQEAVGPAVGPEEGGAADGLGRLALLLPRLALAAAPPSAPAFAARGALMGGRARGRRAMAEGRQEKEGGRQGVGGRHKNGGGRGGKGERRDTDGAGVGQQVQGDCRQAQSAAAGASHLVSRKVGWWRREKSAGGAAKSRLVAPRACRAARIEGGRATVALRAQEVWRGGGRDGGVQEELRRRAEADKLAALSALEEKSQQFMREKQVGSLACLARPPLCAPHAASAAAAAAAAAEPPRPQVAPLCSMSGAPRPAPDAGV